MPRRLLQQNSCNFPALTVALHSVAASPPADLCQNALPKTVTVGVEPHGTIADVRQIQDKEGIRRRSSG